MEQPASKGGGGWRRRLAAPRGVSAAGAAQLVTAARATANATPQPPSRSSALTAPSRSRARLRNVALAGALEHVTTTTTAVSSRSLQHSTLSRRALREALHMHELPPKRAETTRRSRSCTPPTSRRPPSAREAGRAVATSLLAKRSPQARATSASRAIFAGGGGGGAAEPLFVAEPAPSSSSSAAPTARARPVAALENEDAIDACPWCDDQTPRTLKGVSAAWRARARARSARSGSRPSASMPPSRGAPSAEPPDYHLLQLRVRSEVLLYAARRTTRDRGRCSSATSTAEFTGPERESFCTRQLQNVTSHRGFTGGDAEV